MSAYYNENDRHAAQWLRELIKSNLIADGEVDDRSITEVTPSDLIGYTQCHWFAGIGVWSYALRQAGWSDDRPVWTGSCPCQPFSSAGKGGGLADKRHLWPAFHWLIQQCRPNTVFGEQVANKNGAAWFDLVSTDMETEGYTCGQVVFPACGVGAPHMRQRLYWVAELADTTSDGRKWERSKRETKERRAPKPKQSRELSDGLKRRSADVSVADNISDRPQGRLSGRQNPQREAVNGQTRSGGTTNRSSPTNGLWRVADWLRCRDDRWRPVKSGSFPLVNGASARVGSGSNPSLQEVESTSEARVMRIKGYGNAVVAEQAKAFIEAYME